MLCLSGSTVKNSSGAQTSPTHRLLDVPIMIPERADGSSELKGTEGTTQVESSGFQKRCRLRTYMHSEEIRISSVHLRPY